MWIYLHDRLLTNESLCDNYLHPSVVSGVCKTNSVHLGHTFRNCVKPREFWLKLQVSILDLDFWE